MKFQWEHFDILAGRKVQSHNRASTFVIAWAAWKASDVRWSLLDLADGMVSPAWVSKAQLTEALNAGQYRPVDIHPHDVAGSGA